MKRSPKLLAPSKTEVDPEATSRVLDEFQGEHRALRALAAQVMSSERSSQSRRDTFDSLCERLLAHERAEHDTLLRGLESDPFARAAVLEHHADFGRLSVQLDELMQVNPSTPGWIQDYRQLRRRLLRHLSHEEKTLFPLLEQLRSGAPERSESVNASTDPSAARATATTRERSAEVRRDGDPRRDRASVGTRH